MLFAPPPGYNSPFINRQNPQAFNVPGQQGLSPQGYNTSTFGTAALGAPQPSWRPQGNPWMGGPPAQMPVPMPQSGHVPLPITGGAAVPPIGSPTTQPQMPTWSPTAQPWRMPPAQQIGSPTAQPQVPGPGAPTPAPAPGPGPFQPPTMPPAQQMSIGSPTALTPATPTSFAQPPAPQMSSPQALTPSNPSPAPTSPNFFGGIIANPSATSMVRALNPAGF